MAAIRYASQDLKELKSFSSANGSLKYVNDCIKRSLKNMEHLMVYDI